MSYLNDFDRTIALMNTLRRGMFRGPLERAFFDDGLAFEPEPTYAGDFPKLYVNDRGGEFVLTAEIPGVPEGELKLTVDGRSVTLEGARKTEVPRGYVAHRRERGALQFTRTVTLPVKVDAEKTTATARDGVLTVTLPKVPEAQPRQITVRPQS